MATCPTNTRIKSLDLPAEFDDIEGLLQTDLRAVVGMIAQRDEIRQLDARPQA